MEPSKGVVDSDSKNRRLMCRKGDLQKVNRFLFFTEKGIGARQIERRHLPLRVEVFLRRQNRSEHALPSRGGEAFFACFDDCQALFIMQQRCGCLRFRQVAPVIALAQVNLGQITQ